MLPVRYSEVMYRDRKYWVTHIDLNNGDSHKVYAEELDSKNFFSLNYYITQKGENRNSCEMLVEKANFF